MVRLVVSTSTSISMDPEPDKSIRRFWVFMALLWVILEAPEEKNAFQIRVMNGDVDAFGTFKIVDGINVK